MSQINNLRAYLEVLDSSGQLTRINKPVSLVHELSDVAATLASHGKGGVIFEHPGGSEWPIFTNAVVNQNQAALALGCAVSEVGDRMDFVLDPKNGIHPCVVDRASWNENSLRGEAVDIRNLPIPTHGAHDVGQFITGG